jgi:HEAT repeat protein
MSADSEQSVSGPTPEPAPGGEGGPSFRGPGVETEAPGAGAIPGVLRFFVVPLVLVGASLAVFAGLGAVVGQGPPTPEDLVREIAAGGKNSRWQAAQELSNQVHAGRIDLRRDERLTQAVVEAFRRARESGDDARVIQYLARLLGRARPDIAGPVLKEALVDGNPDVRLFVTGALADHGSPSDVETLLARLDDSDPGVRAVAAFGAATVMAGPDREVPAGTMLGTAAWRGTLAKALHDPEIDVRWNAALGLARLGDPAGADLVWSMLHRDYVRENLKPLDRGGSGAAGDPAREDEVVLNALSAAYRLRDRSMAAGVRALATGDSSDTVKDWAMRASELLEREVREKGDVPQRTWTAAR